MTVLTLAERYDAIVDECMALASTWRERIADERSDRSQNAESHRQCILRAARYARLASKAREASE